LVHSAELLFTLLTLAYVGIGGYLAASAILPHPPRRDSLRLAIAVLLCATGEALLVALVLGAVGRLEIGTALALQSVLVAGALGVLLRRPWPDAGGLLWTLGEPLARLIARTGAQLRDHPALSLCLLYGIGVEALRGLLRPPLSWDSLMYHLLLAGTWLQQGDLTPYFGPYPLNFAGLSPANGSLWLWWWMAPSHSELYVNLAFLPHWALLGLSVGGVARELGAHRHWPLAAFLAVLTPVVLRFAATQYVDIFSGAMLVTGCFFGLRWLRTAEWSDALLGGMALGIALGSKWLGLPYAASLLGALLVAARGRWCPRALQGLAVAGTLVLWGSYFWVRNMRLGLGLLFPHANPILPLPVVCDLLVDNAGFGGLGHHELTVWANLGPMIASGQVVDGLLGTTWSGIEDIGIGPAALLLVPSVAALPFAVPLDRRRSALVVVAMIVVQLAVWLFVPVATHQYVLLNTRFLVAAIGLAFAAAAAVAEARGLPGPWASGLALALALQYPLIAHGSLPREVRVVVPWVDLIAALLLLSAGLRAWVRSRAWWLSLGGVAVALAFAPVLAVYRQADRYRAMAEEFTAHRPQTSFFTGAWAWLERNGGDGTVSVVSEPQTHFVYPAMGLRIRRRVVYTNVSESDARTVATYPNCNPRRVPFDEASWLRNLRRQGVRWVLLGRYPSVRSFPAEDQWAQRSRELVLRFSNAFARVYELRDARGGGSSDPAEADVGRRLSFSFGPVTESRYTPAVEAGPS
jgi:ABC-type amino acid transport system permease subunit